MSFSKKYISVHLKIIDWISDIKVEFLSFARLLHIWNRTIFRIYIAIKRLVSSSRALYRSHGLGWLKRKFVWKTKNKPVFKNSFNADVKVVGRTRRLAHSTQKNQTNPTVYITKNFPYPILIFKVRYACSNRDQFSLIELPEIASWWLIEGAFIIKIRLLLYSNSGWNSAALPYLIIFTVSRQPFLIWVLKYFIW